MSQWLKAIDTIANDPDSGASTHSGCSQLPSSSSRELHYFFWPSWAYMWYTYLQKHKYLEDSLITKFGKMIISPPPEPPSSLPVCVVFDDVYSNMLTM